MLHEFRFRHRFRRPDPLLLALFLLGTALVSPLAARQPSDSVPVIIDEIGKLESVRDPKCYATASRLEDFIYGTPLDTEARFAKIELQKELIASVWGRASAAARAAGESRVSSERLVPPLRAAVPWGPAADGDWAVHPGGERQTIITARDKRQYGTIAYALRAILAVQQDAMLDPSARLDPLETGAVELLKEAIDLATLAALQHADRSARERGLHEITPELLRAGWSRVVDLPPGSPPPPAPKLAASARQPATFATLEAIIEKKIAAYQAYNDLSMPVFLRNLQVYFARHGWPDDPEEGRIFRDHFTETMIAFTSDVLLEGERIAKQRNHTLIRVEDLHDALQKYEPHELNQYEDVIFFPRLPRGDRITIEAYDLDAFRDPGIHWVYLREAIADPELRGTLEPDPFAAELLVEGVAQFGVLVLRIAGTIAGAEDAPRLDRTHLAKSMARIQRLLERHAAAPAREGGPDRIASAPAAPPADGRYFTDVTASSGIELEHRLSDWLARFIRSYTVTEGNLVRLAVPPTFGGAGVAAEDIDGDGHADILILSGAGNALYLNDGTGRFRDVTKEAGLEWRRPDGNPGEPRQPIVADFDNDGLQDILITYVDDDHRLYRNLGGARFEDVTARAGLGGKGLVGGPATALDFDGDGLLDLYIGYFGDYLRGELPTLSRFNTNALPNKLFRNVGNFVFEDVTAGSGVANTGWAQSVGHVDFDGDGREDLICGNDFGTNSWYRNLGGGKFEDVSAKLEVDKPSYTMNIGITDLNRDGYPDVYVSNVVTMDKDQKYVLPDEKMRMKFDPKTMANMRVVEANDLFTSIAGEDGLQRYRLSDAVGRGYSSTGWSWDADFFDFDNDGDDDLYVVNGMNEYAVYTSVNPYFTDASGARREVVMPVAEKEVNVFFVNEGGRLVERSSESGADLLGNSRSVAYLDADGDGDLDMIVNAFNGPATFYRNNAESRGNHWLAIRLVGDPEKGVTRDAIGARLIVDGETHRGLWRAVFSTIGYLSVHPKEQHFGLGRDESADLTVIWPNGERERFEGLAADRRYRIVQGEGLARPFEAPASRERPRTTPGALPSPRLEREGRLPRPEAGRDARTTPGPEARVEGSAPPPGGGRDAPTTPIEALASAEHCTTPGRE
ncbi:MAG TPA: CRTAC1 family protein [Thermoanaerobaculia bacterium]|nr:CRTAC1 family protein [Thermoanaerobaculia bacterium]